jgi:lysophospholipase L1-like esterase
MKILAKRPGLPTTQSRRSDVLFTRNERIERARRGITRLFRAGFLAVVLLTVSSVRDGENGEWIDTWSASPQPVWAPDFPAPINFPRNLWNQTIRQIARVSVGGSKLRVVLSNEYGSEPLVIGAAHVALSDQGSAIKAGSDRVLTFSHKESFTIPPGGALAISDPVGLAVPPPSSVAVSLFLPKVTPTATMHWDGRQTAYIAAGNKVADLEITPDSKTESRLFLSGIMVDAAADARAVVTFGDSITDGDDSTLDANNRWPDLLAQRLQANGTPMAILNEGISGARVLSDRMGVNALARFDEDVLTHPHADTVILMMGINDIGWPDSVLDPDAPAPSAEDIIAGYQQLIARAHDHGMRIIGATLTPFAVAFKGTPLEGYYNADKEAKRVALNEWIRHSGAFDGVIDFDAESAIRLTQSKWSPPTTRAITCIQTTPATRPWQSLSTLT